MSTVANPPCPFCCQSFKRLGSHLPSCSKRGGRDYQAFLTSRQSKSSPTHGHCHACGRHFKRLDTHLRVSVTCRMVAPHILPAPTTPPTILSPAPPSLHTTSTAAPAGDANPVTQPHAGDVVSAHQLRQPLRFPRSPEEWEEANYLLSPVTTLVLQAFTAEQKYQVLCEGVYNALSSRFGSKPPPHPPWSKPKTKQHNRALKEVTRLKMKLARSSAELRDRVKICPSSSHSLATSCHCFVTTAV